MKCRLDCYLASSNLSLHQAWLKQGGAVCRKRVHCLPNSASQFSFDCGTSIPDLKHMDRWISMWKRVLLLNLRQFLYHFCAEKPSVVLIGCIHIHKDNCVGFFLEVIQENMPYNMLMHILRTWILKTLLFSSPSLSEGYVQSNYTRQLPSWVSRLNAASVHRECLRRVGISRGKESVLRKTGCSVIPQNTLRPLNTRSSVFSTPYLSLHLYHWNALEFSQQPEHLKTN